MKAVFYNEQKKVVLEITKDAKYELHNGTLAVKKGAVEGVLFDTEGKEIERLWYGYF